MSESIETMWSHCYDQEASLRRGKCLPDPTLTNREIAAANLSLSDLLLPAMTIRSSAVRHNLALQQRWLEQLGAVQAPHAKTHLSPEITAAQLEAGAWGMTVASVHQARLLSDFGARRIILAQQVVDDSSLAALHRLREKVQDLEVFLIIDSAESARLAASSVRSCHAAPLKILLELGVSGGRSGLRSVAELVDLGVQLQACEELELAGIEGFEGILATSRSGPEADRLSGYLRDLFEAVKCCQSKGLFRDLDEILVTAGGSSFSDLVAEASKGLGELPYLLVLRSGGTVVHDHGDLAELAPLSQTANHALGVLQPALEVWAVVTSCPEPGMALIACGKRDLPYDSQLPVLLEARRGERVLSLSAEVTKLNDQHGFVRYQTGAEFDGLAVGDVLRLGPCHPCTAFDKWAVIPVLDEANRVLGVARSYF